MIARPDQVRDLLGIPFSDEQLAVIGAPMEPDVVIAGAGTGKTTVMAARVVWLVASGQVRAEQVLGLTFTRKATAELADRIDSALRTAGALDEGRAGATVSTYDGFAASLVDEYGAWDGIDPGARLITRARCHQLALEVVRDLVEPPAMAERLAPVSIAGAIVGLSDQMGAHLVGADEVREADRRWRRQLDEAPAKKNGDPYADVVAALRTVDEREELLSLVERYQDLKRDRGLVEYADRMAQAAHLAAHRPQVGQDLRGRFAVVLLDEYQDTSSAQAALLTDLFSGPDPAGGLGHPVTAVGDPLQAIYGWRGAAASNILSFARQFPRIGDGGAPEPATTRTLLTNRRSGTRILDCANDISAPLRASAAVAGRVGALRAPDETREGLVACHGHLTWPRECSWVADTLVEAHERGEIDSWSQAAVLVRRNSDVADLHAALAGRQIPVLIANLAGLLQLPDIALVVAHLRIVADRRDDQAWATLLAAPRFGLAPGDLAALSGRARDLARRRLAEDTAGGSGEDGQEHPDAHLADAVADPGDLAGRPGLRAAVARLSAEARVLAEHGVDGPDDLVLRAEQVTGLVDDLAADDPERARSRQGHLDALWAEIHGALAEDPDLTLAGVLAWLAAEEEFGDGLARSAPTTQDAVVISTVHGAKGLEWPLVLLPDLDAGVFPSAMAPDNHITRAAVLPSAVRGDAGTVPQPRSGSRADMAAYKKDLAEESRGAEDRLGYVAATRARDRLIVSWHRWRPSATRPRTPGAYAAVVADRLRGWGQTVPEPPADDDPPAEIAAGLTGAPWPLHADPELADRIADLAARTAQARSAPGAGEGLPDDPAEAALVARWREDADVLLTAHRRGARHGGSGLPRGLTTSQVVALHADRRRFMDQLRRPMPRPVMRGADIGTRFHEWVAGRLRPGGQGRLDLLDEEPVAASSAPDPVLERLKEAFLASRWADATVLAVEEPFALTVGATVIRGRLDAVLADPDDPDIQVVVDWKTSAPNTADPVQLSVYRLAWAGSTGVPLERVRAAFHHVGANRTVEARPLLTSAQLAEVLAPAGLSVDAAGPASGEYLSSEG